MNRSKLVFEELPRGGWPIFLAAFAAVLLLPMLLPRTSMPKASAATLTGDFLWTHDPSRIINCNGKYFVYYTGNNVKMRYLTDLIHWQNGKSVFDAIPPWAHQAVPRAKGEDAWAPDVIFLKNKYYLFYSFSTFGSRGSVIGLATSPTLDPDKPNYHWADQGLVIASTSNDRFNAIDPCPVLDAQGDLWLSFGSWNRGGIQLVKLDNGTGKPTSAPVSIVAGQRTGPEASYLHYHDGFYYVFENEGLCCKGMNSTYEIMMGRSKAITGPYLDKDGRDMARGGGTAFLGTNGEEIGPGCLGILSEGGIDRFSFHFYGSTTNGVPTLGLRRLDWAADGWPQAHSDAPPAAPGLALGRYAIISRSSGLALGVHNNEFADGTAVDQFDYKGGPTQQWNVAPTGDGCFCLLSLGTNKFMDLFQCSPKNGTMIDLYPWFNNDCERWRIEPVGNGAYRIIAKGAGTAMTVPGGAKTRQAIIVGQTWTGDSSQQWTFQKLPRVP